MPQDDPQDDFLTNDPDDTNPMNDIKEDEELPDDVSDDTPFSKPSDVKDTLDPTSQQFDPASDIDSQEEYDAGADVASGSTDS
ncbi:MAG: hypothetical protein JWO47_828 [Candidatus Saccharibacteria bacterium]|nr:hypothetical protein [Candidatus Saccharibacteria bacterium]